MPITYSYAILGATSAEDAYKFLAAGGGTIILALIAYITSKRKTEAEVVKTEADSTKVVTDIALSLVEPLRNQVQDLISRVDKAETRERMALELAATTKEEFAKYRENSDRQIRALHREIMELRERLQAYDKIPRETSIVETTTTVVETHHSNNPPETTAPPQPQIN